jgi:hypothetical protein
MQTPVHIYQRSLAYSNHYSASIEALVWQVRTAL